MMITVWPPQPPVTPNPSGVEPVERTSNMLGDLINIYRFPNGRGAEVTVSQIAGGPFVDSFRFQEVLWRSPSDPHIAFEPVGLTMVTLSLPSFSGFVQELERISALPAA